MSPFHEEQCGPAAGNLLGKDLRHLRGPRRIQLIFGPNDTHDSSTSVHVPVCDAV